MVTIDSDGIVQRVIDILKASTSPDLRLADENNSHPIKKYIKGKPDENELTGQMPVIAVWAGDINGNFIEDAGDANDQQIAHFIAITVLVVHRNNDSEASETAALDLHDDVREVLRDDADLTGTGSALVQNVAYAWSSIVQSTQKPDETDFTTEVALVCRYLLFEDV